ncbi:hypothetical protein S83_043545, partial [Arachis hypogaea]
IWCSAAAFSFAASAVFIWSNQRVRSKFHDIAEVYKPCQRDVVKTELKHQC